jgi:hypothetical protein
VESLFPEEKIAGAMEGMRVSLLSNLEGKSISGGEILVAEAVAPGPVSPEQLTPTCLRLLKGLLQQRREAEWVCVYLAEDSALAASYNWLATAEYHRGKVTLRGGHPTPSQMDSLRAKGIAVHRPQGGESKLVAEVFAAHSGLKAERWELSQSLRGASLATLDRETFFHLVLDTRKLFDIGKIHGRTGPEIRNLVSGVTRYYWLRAGEPWQP